MCFSVVPGAEVTWCEQGWASCAIMQLHGEVQTGGGLYAPYVYLVISTPVLQKALRGSSQDRKTHLFFIRVIFFRILQKKNAHVQWQGLLKNGSDCRMLP